MWNRVVSQASQQGACFLPAAKSDRPLQTLFAVWVRSSVSPPRVWARLGLAWLLPSAALTLVPHVHFCKRETNLSHHQKQCFWHLLPTCASHDSTHPSPNSLFSFPPSCFCLTLGSWKPLRVWETCGLPDVWTSWTVKLAGFRIFPQLLLLAFSGEEEESPDAGSFS